MPQLCRIQATSCVWWERKTLQHYSPKTAIQQAINCCPHLCCVGHSSCAKTVDKLAPTYYFSAGGKKKEILSGISEYIYSEWSVVSLNTLFWMKARRGVGSAGGFQTLFSPLLNTFSSIFWRSGAAECLLSSFHLLCCFWNWSSFCLLPSFLNDCRPSRFGASDCWMTACCWWCMVLASGHDSETHLTVCSASELGLEAPLVILW